MAYAKATAFGGGGGLSDPMTTRGDIIVRDAANESERLAIGASTFVLTSDGTDVAWGNVTTNANLTGHITSVGNAAVLGSFTSLQLKTALTDETGSGAAVFGTYTNEWMIDYLENELSNLEPQMNEFRGDIIRWLNEYRLISGVAA